MMHWVKRFFRPIVLGLSLIIAPVSFAGPGINSIVVLGDSLSDQGRWYRISFGLLPQYPYYQGRFSNGPVWVEYMAEAMGFNPNDLINYALGGTTTNFELDWWSVPYSLSWELAEFFTDYFFSSKSGRLYVIWSGGNDYWATQNPDSAYSVVDTIIDNVVAIMDQGGRYFLLPNMPDMSLSPYAVKYGIAETLPAVVNRHNTYMHARIEQLRAQHPDAVIVELDISLLMDALASGAIPESNITNTKDSCYSGNYFGDGDVLVPGFLAQHGPSLQNFIENSPPLKVAAAVSKQAEEERQLARSSAVYPNMVGDDVIHHCPGYFFWDDIHPTTHAHKLLGKTAAQLLQAYGFHRN